MDYYTTLGVSPTAGQDEIRQAYKKLAMKHHPDRGGDTKLFQEISQANEVLSDVQKRAQYDAERQGFGNHGPGGQQFHWTTQGGNPFDPFAQMFGGGNPFEQMFAQQAGMPRRKNRDLNIRCTISFKQSFTGTELEASYALPSGKTETVVIKVPAGINSGQAIRYGGMGDDTHPSLPRGDLNVTVVVTPDANYERRGDDLVVFLTLNPIEAMVGCTKLINTLDDNAIKINVRPGVGHGTEYMNRGQGFRNVNSGYQGNLVIHIRLEVPAITDPILKSELEALYARINKTS